MSEPIHRTLKVNCSVEHAFRTFTQSLDLWWPPGHRRNGRKASTLVMESRVGGRFFERAQDGAEFDFGRILSWDPPAGLAYAWFMGSSRDTPTEVKVAFVPDGKGTLVDILHSPAKGTETWPKANVIYRKSWTAVLEAFSVACDLP